MISFNEERRHNAFGNYTILIVIYLRPIIQFVFGLNCYCDGETEQVLFRDTFRNCLNGTEGL